MSAWLWIAKPNGAVVLVEVETGHIVMDCVRKAQQACTPRFANWPGVSDGEDRAGREGAMSMAQSWFGPDGRIKHPDARVIEVSRQLRDALQAAQAKLTAALRPEVHPRAVPVLVAEAHAIQADALALLQARSA
jgi:hypothetical protein